MTHEGVESMGRGRQKAKQTKVARRLKYYSPETDYDALQRELARSDGASPQVAVNETDGDDGELDAYERWAADTNH
jgi:hypothetical protein